MDKSWLKVLVDNISSFLSLTSTKNIYTNPSHNYYYTKVETISNLLKPFLENLLDVAPSELLNNLFEELARYIDELRDRFEISQPLSSRILNVLRIESLARNLQESSLEFFKLMKLCEQDLPWDLISPSLEECIELLKLFEREEISYTIDQALIQQKKGIGLTLEVLVKIAKSIGLRTNQDILIESVVLENMKDNVDFIENNTEVEFLDGLISLTTRMHDYLTKIEPSKLRYPVPLPPDFRCSLSLELMSDPVIVESGQTYERVYIEKWIDMGLVVCPKTRKALSHTNLTPNFIVKALIENWCDSNNVSPLDPLEMIHSSKPFALLVDSDGSDGANKPVMDDSPKHEEQTRQALGRSTSAPSLVSQVIAKTETSTSKSQARLENVGKLPSMRRFRHHGIIQETIREDISDSSTEKEVKKLIKDLRSPFLDIQREATSQIRILSRNSEEIRDVIAKQGAIILLIDLLYSNDDKIQVEAVTSLLNLSINNNNKTLIVENGAIEPLVHVLKTGTLEEAKENSAVTLYSLSSKEETMRKISKAGAIEPLVELLGHGTLQGKKDAATTLCNLTTITENRGRVIEAGGVKYLIEMMDPKAGLAEKAVFVLANLATTKEGKEAIVEQGGVRVLVDFVELGSARGKENATSALLMISMDNSRFCNIVVREGVIPPLVALTKSGTHRAKDKV
ncbi:unnamed protein product [Cochlearia groenlandica]